MPDEGNRQNVVVTDIRMPFLSMVIFMVKWAIAAIPAIIFLTVIGGFVWGMLMGFMFSSTTDKKTVSGIELPSLILTSGEPTTPPEAKHLVGLDERAVEQGKALFNGKAVCSGCHGINGDIKQVKNPDMAKLNHRPADLREPSDKSVRQLYLSIKYGIHRTGMLPIHEHTGIRDEDIFPLLSYVLALQGTPLSQDEMFEQLRRRDGEAEQAILAMCDEQAIGDDDALKACVERSTKRYRDLVVGRPADIPKARYAEIQASCRQRFGTDLDGLARCYGLEYGITRKSSK